MENSRDVKENVMGSGIKVEDFPREDMKRELPF
jgi:hypothetical protein